MFGTLIICWQWNATAIFWCGIWYLNVQENFLSPILVHLREEQFHRLWPGLLFLMAAKLDKIFKYSLLYQPTWGFEPSRLCNAAWPTLEESMEIGIYVQNRVHSIWVSQPVLITVAQPGPAQLAQTNQGVCVPCVGFHRSPGQKIDECT